MPKVSQFTSVFAKAPSSPVELDAILEGVKGGRWRERVCKLRRLKGKAYSDFKKTLPGFTTSGVFSRKNDDNLEQYSGLVQVDIDYKDNRDLDFSDMWAAATSCPYTYAAFRSPNGKGVKVIARCPDNAEEHPGSYKAAAAWLSDKGLKVDTQVCALSQLCFVSYDPDLFLNRKAKTLKPLPFERDTETSLTEYEETRTEGEVLDACHKASSIFQDLWEGDYRSITDDRSNADHMLICLLRDNCHSNEMVAELFAKSGLYREEKWGGRTRDYVFQSLSNSEAVKSLSSLPIVDEPDDDPGPQKKKKKAGWAWDFVSEIPDWTQEDDHYIVKRMLHEGTVSCVYGPSGSGKTFLVFDLCAAIATGKPWNGHKVRRGGVAYFGLEGKHGIKKRIQAMRTEGRLGNEDPFARVMCDEDPLNLLDPAHVSKCSEMVSAMAQEKGVPIKVIVIDTLAKSTPGGEENSTKDMGLALVNAQAIADKTGCCVVVVHHSGKDTAKGMRGSSALPAGFDSVFKIHRHEDDTTVRVFHIDKQRDESDEGDLFFKLEVFSLGDDTDGEPVTTCLVKFLEDSEVPVKKSKDQLETDNLMQLVPDGGISFADLMAATGLSRSTLQRRVLALVADFSLRKDEKGNLHKVFDILE